MARHVARIVRYPASPRWMAGRVALWLESDVWSSCQGITAPTFILTGEPALDRVVPVESTLDYLTAISHARHAVLPRTGHLGLVTRPEAFALRDGLGSRRP